MLVPFFEARPPPHRAESIDTPGPASRQPVFENGAISKGFEGLADLPIAPTAMNPSAAAGGATGTV